MSKTSKYVPQKVTSSSQPTTEIDETTPDAVDPERPAADVATNELVVEPPLKMFIPGDCSINDYFKVEKLSSVQGRREEASRYICSINEDVLTEVRTDCNRADKDIVVPDNESFTVIPDTKEIRDVVFNMDPASAAGPDGYNGKFFQFCWDIIKEDITNFVQAVFNDRRLAKFFSHTCLVLIPKVDSPCSFSDLRPISLSNFTAKIISKILSKRLNPILGKLISENQSGFVKGRLITENILLAQEIAQGVNKKNRGGNVIIKLDMTKAYERIS
uniref:Uncharacterized protein LOC104221892 n=1 Tax=Nicotiana sylvestris TaxID=4096 RepID=A0A1U7VTY1_NICSY|nr:PREDICTED: uncharacterized protein LOC104221892 [Nicotiana sylvestris]